MNRQKTAIKFLSTTHWIQIARSNRKLIEEFVRYSISGAISLWVQFGILVVCIKFFQFNATLSSAIGFTASCVANYLLLYYWTFRTNGKPFIALFRYSIVMAFTLGLNSIIFWTLNVPLEVDYLSSQSVGTGVTALVNFILNRLYTFV